MDTSMQINTTNRKGRPLIHTTPEAAAESHRKANRALRFKRKQERAALEQAVREVWQLAQDHPQAEMHARLLAAIATPADFLGLSV